MLCVSAAEEVVVDQTAPLLMRARGAQGVIVPIPLLLLSQTQNTPLPLAQPELQGRRVIIWAPQELRLQWGLYSIVMAEGVVPMEIQPRQMSQDFKEEAVVEERLIREQQGQQWVLRLKDLMQEQAQLPKAAPVEAQQRLERQTQLVMVEMGQLLP